MNLGGTCWSALQKRKFKPLDVAVLTMHLSVPIHSANAALINMKTPHSFSQNRFVSTFRFASAVALLFAAAGMAFVAIKPSSPTLVSSQNRLPAINKLRADRDQLAGNSRALPGDQEGGPLLAALEDYAHRAYPAKDVPMSATLNALAGFRHVKAMSMESQPPARGS